LRPGDEILVIYDHRRGPRQEGSLPYVQNQSPGVQPVRAPAPAPRR
jgi:hypothetical protein